MCDHNCCIGGETELKIGDTLPALELSAYLPVKDEDVTLKMSDYKDKWKVFVFYPADFTFVCPTELEELAHPPVRS
jgi:peroxiredoxin (alkyl hydroperoxide reductase subunit C)